MDFQIVVVVKSKKPTDDLSLRDKKVLRRK